MARVFEVTFIKNSEWSLPFNFALGLHIVFLVGALYGPQYFNKKPLFPEIYTVDLINIEAPVQPTDPSPPPIEQAPEQQTVPENKPDIKKAAAPVLEVAKPEQPSESVAEPISIKPLKRKLVRKEQPAPAEQQKKTLEQIRKQRLEEMRQADERAAETARLAAMEAVNQLKSMIRETNNTTPPDLQATARPSRASAGSNSRNVIENQYFASVFSTLQPHWKLPEYKLWDAELSATVVIRIARDGSITNQFFEKKSGDKLFDQFVLKTLQDGAPLPPLPAALQKNSLELGLRFVPGSIQQ